MCKNNVLSRKTKILATIGPSLENVLNDALKKADGIRFNMSHANIEYCKRFSDIIKNHGLPRIMDLEGIKIRVKEIKGKTEILEVKEGEKIDIMNDLVLSYIPKKLREGDRILICDGKIELEVCEIKENSIIAVAKNSGVIEKGNGVNFPDTDIDLPAVTEKDMKNLEFAIQEDFEYVCISFVKTKEDVKIVRDFVEEKKGDISIISKIETNEAVRNLEEIIKESDGILVARGDLGVEVPVEKLPIIQKEILRKANSHGKLTITATHILHSMVKNDYPTRAEVTDIANAIFDGSDCLMLSNETAIGKHPLKVLEVLDKICREVEKSIDVFGYKADCIAIPEATLFFAVKEILNKITPDTIVVPTYSGKAGIYVSKMRPYGNIYCLSFKESTKRKLRLAWGVLPYTSELSTDGDFEEILETARKVAMEKTKKGKYLIAFSYPPGKRKTHIIEFEEIK